MLVPLSWLHEYVPIPADPAKLVERLTLAGLEAAGVRVFGLPVPAGLRVKPEDAGLVWERDKVVVAVTFLAFQSIAVAGSHCAAAAWA